MGNYNSIVKNDISNVENVRTSDSAGINKKDSKKKKSSRVKTICSYTFCATLLFGLGGTAVKSGIEAHERFSGLDTSLMNKTLFQTPVSLDTKDGEVLINIKDAFSDYQKEQIVDGITKLDNILDGINYTVTFEDKDVKKAINITSADSLKNNSALAETKVFINNFSAKIVYPVTIVVNNESLKYYPRALSGVIQHELLHTLGFTDLHGSDHVGYLMYYSYYSTNKYSPEELAILNQVYSKDYTGLKESRPTTVIRPTELEVIDKTETENFSASDENLEVLQ